VAPGRRSIIGAFAAAIWTAVAAWLSSGTIAFAGAGGSRFGVLPGDAFHAAISLTAGLLVFAIARRVPARVGVAVLPLALTILPWLPFPVPSAFLIWTGAFASLPWLATLFALAAIVFVERGNRLAASRGSAVAAGVLSFGIFAACAWLASPALPVGDEPHYLVVTQSLLYDHDLKIENNHQRGDYRDYYRGELLPHYVRRGRNGAIYSMHAPGLPALVLPAFAIAGYRGVVVFLLVISAAAAALAWWLAWRVSGDVEAAWFGWATVALAAPFVLDSFTVFPDGPAAAFVLVGFWALLQADWERERCEASKGCEAGEGHEAGEGYKGSEGTLRWLLFGLAFAALPWMHTRFAVLAATLGGLVLVRLAHVPNAMSKAVAFLCVPAVSALGWLFFFVIVYGAPDPTAPFGDTQNSFAALPDGLGGLLFDQGFGLLATAPVLVFAFAGFARVRRLALEWGVTAAPYLLAIGTYPVWWAGTSGPARFLVPLMPPLAIPAACAWKSSTRGVRTAMIALVAVSAWYVLVIAGGGSGRLGFHTRSEAGTTGAPWLEWANPVVDLAAAAPAYVPLPGGSAAAARSTAASVGLLVTLPWLVCLGGALALTGWFVDRRTRPAEAAVSVCAVACAVAVMAAATIVWVSRHSSPIAVVAGQMQALRASTGPRAFAIDLTGHPRFHRVAVRTLPIEVPIQRTGRGGFRGPNRPLASFPLPPAGSYALVVRRHGVADGWIMAGVGSDQFSIVTDPMPDADSGVRINLPVAVSALSVRAEEAGRDQLDAIVLRPLAIATQVPSRGVARRAVRYGETTAFFMDEGAYPEPAGLWVGGGRDTVVVFAPDEPETGITLWLRNGPAANIVTLESGSWRTQVALAAGEERRANVPFASPQASVRVRIASAATFRPSTSDPNSHDTRLLGVFVTVGQN
jgi:hypothetical protein